MSKIIIGVSIAAAVTVGTILVVNNNENTAQNNKILTDLKTEDTVKKEIQLQEVIIKDSSINEKSTIEKDISKDVINDVYSVEKEEKSIQFSDDNIKKSQNDLNTITSQENKNNSQNGNIDSDQKSNPLVVDEAKEQETVIYKSTPKEEFVSELNAVQIHIETQNNQYVVYKVEGVPNSAYVVWDFGDGTIERTLNPEHFYNEAGNYTVKCTVKTDKEEVTKILPIEIKISGEIRDLPNVFTPNGDGNNDEFFVNCKNIKNFQLTIIDNHQNIIFSTNDVDFRWNGFDKAGQPVKEGTYYYIIVAEDESGNTINKYQQLRLQR